MTPSTRRLRAVIQGDIGEAFRAALTADVELELTPSLQDEDVAPMLENADAWISSTFTAAMAERANRLKMIHTPGAGTNAIDFDAVPPAVTVCNVGGHEVGVAEHVLMSMLALSRDLIGMNERAHRGSWQDRFRSQPKPELRDRTVGLIGMGAISAEIARMARAFNMRVIAVTRNPDPARAEELGIDYLGSMSDLHQILGDADFVVASVPLSDGTRGMIGATEFAAMKDSAYFINIARGHVVQEVALYEALRDKVIAGAALDVWYRYPVGDEQFYGSEYPIHELDNVIMSPHVAGWTDGTFKHRWAQINENLRRLSEGEPLLGVVAPSQQGS